MDPGAALIVIIVGLGVGWCLRWLCTINPAFRLLSVQAHSNHHVVGDGYYAGGNTSRISMRKVRTYMGSAHHKDAKGLSQVPESLLEHAKDAGKEGLG